MRKWSTKRWTAIVATFAALGVVAPIIPGGFVLLAIGAVLAVGALILGKGWGRPVPAVTLAAIVVAATLAPVKMSARVPGRRMTVPKPVMTIGEMRESIAHGLDRVRTHPPTYFDDVARFDDLVVRFPSTEMTQREFIRAIEAQTPLRHHVATCGTGATILGGGAPMALLFGESH